MMLQRRPAGHVVRTSKFTEEQIAYALKQAELGTPVAEVLRGAVSNFSKERATGDFLLSDADRSTAGLTAVAAALAGSGGAIGLASLAGTKEEADKVAFELDGKKVTGWLMWSPFKNGDEVEVAAELMRDGTYRAFAVLKPNDRTIALYPHCSRGRIAHYKNSIKWIMIAFSFVFLGSCGVMAIIFFCQPRW